MPKSKKCPVCHLAFPKRSYWRHHQKFFDKSSNSWLDHEPGILFPVLSIPNVNSEPTSDPFPEFNHCDRSESDFDVFEDPFNVSGVYPVEEDEQANCFEVIKDNSNLDDSQAEDDCDSIDEDTDDEETEKDGPEYWDIPPEAIDEEMGIEEKPQASFIDSLLFYFIYGILYWQIMNHISDNGLDYMLHFLYRFFQCLGAQVNHAVLNKFCIAFPPSLYMARKLLSLDRDSFKRLVVCPSCHKLYELFECVEEVNGVRVPKTCTNEISVRGRSTFCNSSLMKQVICKGSIRKFYPLKVYCLNSVISGLENILKRKDIKGVWEHWKDWEKDDDILRDIYDGAVWKKFQKFKSESFLSDCRGIGLMMNVDWFQPFKHRNDYSVGVIYFVIMNLPRNMRYKSENVIIAGLIPSMKKEPKLNPFLEPLVKELQILWKGIKLKSSISPLDLTFRAALLCVSCDIPAARKCCGFKSHSAKLGCHKCFKVFQGSFGEKRDYSGFDRQNWKPRTKSLHNIYATRVKNAKNKTEFERLSKQYGTYYSVLIELEYFDAISFCVIDPMHNLFLGTAKTVFKIWVEKKILDQVKLDKIEERLQELNSSTDIGRIPTHISGNYGVFTASEWKNWTTIFSLYALCGILPNEDYKCWERFVLACRILCKPYLTKTDIEKADVLLLNFCKNFERLYGPQHVTCNMHLHCHLKEVLLDYGPFHVYWCFSFERFNGTFGKYHTNNKGVEIQFMRKIMTTKFCESMNENLEMNDGCNLFEIFFEKSCDTDNMMITDVVKILKLADTTNYDFAEIDCLSFISFPNAYKLVALDKEDLIYLMASYRKMYPSVTFDVEDFGELTRIFSSLTILGEKFGSKQDCRKLRSANILANWYCPDGGDEGHSDFRPCRIDFFFSHTAKINGKNVSNVFAKVSWYKEYSDRYKYGTSLQLWFSNRFEAGGYSTFLPVQRIYSRFCRAITGESKDLMAVCPIQKKILSENE